MTDKAFSGIPALSLSVLLHNSHSLANSFLFAPHLAVCDYMPRVVKTHQRTDTQNCTDRCGRSRNASAAPEIFQICGEKLVVHFLPVVNNPLFNLFKLGTAVAHVGGHINQKAVTGGAAHGIHNNKLSVRELFP